MFFNLGSGLKVLLDEVTVRLLVLETSNVHGCLHRIGLRSDTKDAHSERDHGLLPEDPGYSGLGLSHAFIAPVRRPRFTRSRKMMRRMRFQACSSCFSEGGGSKSRIHL